jgi:hypothetical protein
MPLRLNQVYRAVKVDRAVYLLPNRTITDARLEAISREQLVKEFLETELALLLRVSVVVGRQTR